MLLKNLREKINLSIYNSKDIVLGFFRWTQVLVALSMIGVLIYYYGFPQTVESKEFLNQLIEFSFLFYILRFVVRMVFDFNPINFIRLNWGEALMVLLLIIIGTSRNIFGYFVLEKTFNKIGIYESVDFSNVIIQIVFLVYIFLEVFRKRNFRQYFKMHPGLLFMLSILGIILIGMGMLLLPEMTLPGNNLSLVDALFLSTSATSCTGLSTIAMGDVLSFKGELVILFLIQAGALNTVAFVAIYILLAKFGIGLKQHDLIEDYVSSVSFLDSERIFFRIVKWTLLIELVGVVFIFFLLKPIGEFAETSSRLYHSVYITITSFCNAGMLMLPDSFQNQLIVNNYFLQLVVIGLFFLGGFGMIYLFDMFGIRNLRERMKYPWKTLRFDTKVNLYTTLAFIIVGAFMFYIFEKDGSLRGESTFGTFVSTLFNSMMTRHTGSPTVEYASLSIPFLVFSLFLMFVGASPGSSGGGIRVTTFAVLLSSVVATVRGKNRVELLKRTIDNSLVLKAYSIFMFFLIANLLGVFALTVSEHKALAAGSFTVFDIIVEHVSASCTAGVSMGLTTELTVPGKIIITFAMFTGRVGILSIAYLFGRQISGKRYKYPQGHITFG